VSDLVFETKGYDVKKTNDSGDQPVKADGVPSALLLKVDVHLGAAPPDLTLSPSSRRSMP
jgi:hypothetical protein